jgi:hypothetical protein
LALGKGGWEGGKKERSGGGEIKETYKTVVFNLFFSFTLPDVIFLQHCIPKKLHPK